MFAQHGKTGDDVGETEDDKQKNEKILTTSPAMIVEKKANMHETANDPHRKKLKEDAESFRKIKQ